MYVYTSNVQCTLYVLHMSISVNLFYSQLLGTYIRQQVLVEFFFSFPLLPLALLFFVIRYNIFKFIIIRVGPRYTINEILNQMKLYNGLYNMQQVRIFVIRTIIQVVPIELLISRNEPMRFSTLVNIFGSFRSGHYGFL